MTRLLAFVVALLALPAAAQYRDLWTPYDGRTGMSCLNFNHGAQLPWKARGGDVGPVAVTLNKLPVAGQVLTFDVTALLGAEGLVVRGNRAASAHSREAADPALRPRLVVTRTDGSVVTVPPYADSTVTCSAQAPTGTAALLRLGAEPTMLFFPSVPDAQVARLELTVAQVYSGVALPTYTVAPVLIPRQPVAPVQYGLAAKYDNDRGIEADPAVLWHTGYEPGQKYATKCPVSNPPAAGYVPTDGNASENFMGLRGTWDHCGPGGREYFGREFREVFIRVEMRFGSDYRDTVNEIGGKLPVGLNAQYDVPGTWSTYCGNGGQSCASGDRGWSARGGYLMINDRNNPVYPRVQGHQYVYHYGQTDFYGTNIPWGAAGLFELNRWYTVEMQLIVNDPGQANGVMRWWVDGRLSREVTGFAFRGPTTLAEIAALGGEQLVRGAWVTWFHGGKNPPDNGVGMHGWTDNVVVATQYIGPRKAMVRFDGPLYCAPGTKPACQ